MSVQYSRLPGRRTGSQGLGMGRTYINTNAGKLKHVVNSLEREGT